MDTDSGCDPYINKKPSQGPSGRLIIAEKPGFEKKKLEKNFRFFFNFDRGDPMKIDEKISKIFRKKSVFRP